MKRYYDELPQLRNPIAKAVRHIPAKRIESGNDYDRNANKRDAELEIDHLIGNFYD